MSRLDTLCPDFTVEDRWRIPIEADPARGDDFVAFYRVFVANGLTTDSWAANSLFRLRFALGRALGWDSGPRAPIPGCAENAVAARLTAADRARDRSTTIALPDLPGFSPVYLFDDEAMLEVSNKTVHAVIHLAWVDADAPGKKTVALTVLVKSRGRRTDAYMALIKPFRHRLVYPAWFRAISRAWDARA